MRNKLVAIGTGKVNWIDPYGWGENCEVLIFREYPADPEGIPEKMYDCLPMWTDEIHIGTLLECQIEDVIMFDAKSK